ncbi:MAG: DNA alkylation repair protein [Phycisphaerales bacterium]
MNLKATLKALQDCGSAQTRKTYARHGATEPMFGVSYADLGKLVKAIGWNHALALELWKSGNHDARTLATMIADPAKMKKSELESWAKTPTGHFTIDAVGSLAAKSPHARALVMKWIASKHEMLSATGWQVLASLAGGGHGAKAAPDAAGFSDEEFAELLTQIETTIHDAPNRTRHCMNSALIAIGLRNPNLQKQALAAAKRIGKVTVDHGQTCCKTPDASAYIAKAAARKKKKISKA